MAFYKNEVIHIYSFFRSYNKVLSSKIYDNEVRNKMFFIGVFGIENKSKEIKTLNNLTCKKCDNKVDGRLIKYFDFFHFFFIPLFKWNEKYYVLCDKCKCVYSIPKDKGKAIERGEDVQITYWDLQEVYDNDYVIMNNNSDKTKICSKCGGKVNSDFKYCPYCGREI